ncbi:MAG: endonuclease, partial [Solirubrobacteraceae bacterium]|nr:endonuclease [Solirubrobacteraceae bacterium]
MPEGDTIHYAAKRVRSVLEGRVPEEILTPQRRHERDRWPERLAGRTVRSVDAHGKHMFLRFDGNVTLHSHLRMTGAWAVYERGRRWRRSPRRAWLVLRTPTHDVIEFDGPVLELMTESRTRFDQRLSGLGPDVLADEFDAARFLARLRQDDPTRGIGDALLDQRTLAGIGNLWKAEACWEAGIDPWRPTAEVSDDEALAIIAAARPRMQESAAGGHQRRRHAVYRHEGRPCPRCGGAIRLRGQGDDN